MLTEDSVTSVVLITMFNLGISKKIIYTKCIKKMHILYVRVLHIQCVPKKLPLVIENYV